jgi:hypothetical protein
VGDVGRGAADLLVTAGVVAAVPTAAAGLNDWSDTAGSETRVGLVHAAVNTTALSLYLASVVAGARGRRRGGQALGLAGLGVLPGGGYLGGHLCFVLGVDVNRTAWEQRASQGTPVLADTELADGELCRADAGGVPVLLYRTDGTVYAPASTCTHMGGPLQEDTISDGCVTYVKARASIRPFWMRVWSLGSGVLAGLRMMLASAYRKVLPGLGQALRTSAIGEGRHRRHRSARLERTRPKEAVPLQNGGYACGWPWRFDRAP